MKRMFNKPRLSKRRNSWKSTVNYWRKSNLIMNSWKLNEICSMSVKTWSNLVCILNWLKCRKKQRRENKRSTISYWVRTCMLDTSNTNDWHKRRTKTEGKYSWSATSNSHIYAVMNQPKHACLVQFDLKFSLTVPFDDDIEGNDQNCSIFSSLSFKDFTG